ncbi:hypothetical protein BpHYR1_000117 [Brachionus plicatilis]|uniref:Uncharacterized protein n=1 Tax=Brachionus plicatilis TaxID=10195 RepID=A0A3M7RHY1_BRAPC|nr:hypothetical protein BpHYR1_000117 [Brachionus plicatilis]
MTLKSIFSQLFINLCELTQYNLKLTCTFLFLDSSSTFPFPNGIVEEESRNKMRTKNLNNR